ncbi:MAG: cytochrome c [Gammaproteobacteria bacterium]|nr:cytochrome c [Gammaproteobacteria bacterium]
MKILTGLGLVILLSLLGIVGFAYSGIYDVGANANHGRLLSWFLVTTRKASVERRSRNTYVPDLAEESLVLAGINDFNSMCVTCHGAPGVSPDALGKGLNPPAPDLAKRAFEMSPAELFWLTKNGVMMTGMPAWGATHGDDAIWPVVAFMTRLPELDATGYQQMLVAAAGHGHHGDDSKVSEHDHDEADESPASAIHVHDDGAAHDHGVAETPAPERHDHGTHSHNND